MDIHLALLCEAFASERLRVPMQLAIQLLSEATASGRMHRAIVSQNVPKLRRHRRHRSGL